MTVAEYRQHPSAHFSRLKLALQSAAHYANPPPEPEDKSPFLQGTMLHAYALEGRWIDYVTRPKFNPYTNDEKDTWWTTRKWCRQWTSEQVLPILDESQVEDQLGMRNALKNHPVVQEIFESCPEREKPMFANYNGLELKALLDLAGHNNGRRVIGDLKSCYDCSPEGFARIVTRQKYCLQLALYSAVTALAEGLDERPSWLWIAVESKRPWNVQIYEPSPQHYEVGERQLNYVVNLVKKCKETGVYPGYSEGVTELPFRKWDDFQPEPQPE